MRSDKLSTMQKRALAAFLLLAVLGILLGCNGGRKPPADTAPQTEQKLKEREAETRAIEAVLSQMSQGFARGKLELLENIWAPQATIFEQGRGFRSWEEYRDDHLEAEFAGLAESEWVMGNVIMQIEGHVAWVEFSTHFAATRHSDNQRIFSEGRGTAILLKTKEGWRIAHLHLS